MKTLLPKQELVGLNHVRAEHHLRDLLQQIIDQQGLTILRDNSGEHTKYSWVKLGPKARAAQNRPFDYGTRTLAARETIDSMLGIVGWDGDLEK